MMKVIGIDPALRNLGLIRGKVIKDKLVVIDAVTYKTKPRKKTSELKDGEHDTYCAMYLYDKVAQEIRDYKPKIIGVEIGSGAQSHKAAAALGAMKGFIGSLMANFKELEWVVVSPAEAKTVIKKNADKELIQAWVLDKHKNYEWDTTKCRFEHQADAVIIMHAALLKLREKRN